MDGQAVFKFAVKVLDEVARRDAGGGRPRSARDVDWLIPHQANVRILEATAQEARPAAWSAW